MLLRPALFLLPPRTSYPIFTSTTFRNMFSGNQANASGLTPDQSKALKERSAQPHEEKIITALKEMYSCKPQQSTFDVYTNDAIFHDPVGFANGPDSIRAQFVGLAKIFERADIPKFSVLENPPSLPQSTILIDQDVSYYRDGKASSPTKTVNSLLTVETNESHQITRHTEEWNHNKQTTSDDGFFGILNEQRKKLTASITDTVVGKM